MKLDMQKAYDRVKWKFLRESLLKMGFSSRWVGLIMHCVSTTTFSVKINGEPIHYLKPSRGLKQGDPLSPYLFILVLNVLSWLMQKAMVDGNYKGITLNTHCPTLSHLLFADDAIFFLDGTILECQNPATILNQYCFATGQVINLNKSGVYFSRGCPPSLKQNLAQELKVPIIDKTGKYLGIPTN